MSQLRFRSTPIIIGNFESCFKQRDESTVNAAVSNHPRNMSLSTESPAKWAFAGFGEGVLTVAIESEAKGQLSPRRPGDWAARREDRPVFEAWLRSHHAAAALSAAPSLRRDAHPGLRVRHLQRTELDARALRAARQIKDKTAPLRPGTLATCAWAIAGMP
jgi:hypothetical protein